MSLGGESVCFSGGFFFEKKTMKTNIFNSLPIIAHAVGRKCGVKVQCSGDTACTDGRVVVLPESETIPQDALLGYLVHECAHIRYTDFSIAFENSLIRWLTNMYEDARIERKISKEYIGAHRLLISTMQFLQNEEQPEMTDSIESILNFVALDCWCRHRHMENVLRDAYMKSVARVRMCISSKEEAQIRQINDELPKATRTADCLALAQKLYAWLENKLKSSDSNASSSASEQSSPNQDQNAQSKAGSVQVGETPENKEKTVGQSTGEPIQAPSDVQASTSNATEEKKMPKTASDLASYEVGNQLSQYDISSQMKQEIDRGGQRDSLLPQGQLGMKRTTIKDLSEKAKVMVESGRRNSVGLRRQLQGLVQAQCRCKKRPIDSGRRINARRVARLSAWNPRVFTKLETHESTATAVHLLLDMSGSMRGFREQIAGESAIALFLALKTLPHCNPALSIFRGRGKTISIFAHGENLTQQTAGRLSELEAGGGTPLFQGLADVLVELAQTKEKRKVIFVVTDGDPDEPHETHALVKAIEASPGIDIVGIGICSETSWLFDKSVRLDDVTKLPEVLFGLAKDLALAGIR